MKLLFDNNLSPRLSQRLADVFSGATHVSAVGLDRAERIRTLAEHGSGGLLTLLAS